MARSRERQDLLRPAQHRIDAAAKKLFESQIPDAWIINPHIQDYGIDYNLEIVQGDLVTGQRFFVQLKGTTRPQFSRTLDSIKFSLELRHASYYVDRASAPVFLVVVDTLQKRAYWIFIQQYLLNLSQSRNWREKGSVSIDLPLANVLTDTESLANAVESAIKFMAQLHPQPIREVVARRREFLESLDSRFSVSLSISEQIEQISVSPKEPVEFRLHFRGDKANLAAKLDRVFGLGLPTKFEAHEVETSGSLLLSEIFKEGFVIQSGVELDGAIVLSTSDATGKTIGSPMEIPARISGGTREVRFNAGVDSSPLRIETSANPTLDKSEVKATFDLGKWHGQLLLTLSHFDRLVAVFASEFAELRMQLLVQGNHLVKGFSKNASSSFFSSLAKYLQVLSKARFLARHFGVSPVYSRELNSQEMEDISRVYDMLTIGESRISISRRVYSFSISSEGYRNLQKIASTDEPSDGTFRLDCESTQHLRFLGEEIAVGRLSHEFTHVAFATSKRSRRGQGTKSTKCLLNCSANSEHVFRIIE